MFFVGTAPGGLASQNTCVNEFEFLSLCHAYGQSADTKTVLRHLGYIQQNFV